MKSIVLIIILILIIIVIISTIYSKVKIDITRYNIKNKKIDKNIKLIFLSDLHNRKDNSKIIDIIKEEKPDIIIDGGDMIYEDLNSIGNFINFTNELKDYKTYYTYGNHETRLDCEEINIFEKVLGTTELVLLNNKSTKLSKNINLCGFVSDYDCYKKFHKLCLSKKYIFERVKEFDEYKYNILVDHNPLEFDAYVKTNADLVLSGHVHGGLVYLPFLGALLSPDYTFFPKYANGEYNKNKTKMIVSRGLGFSKRIPFRVNNPGEIVIINLIKD